MELLEIQEIKKYSSSQCSISQTCASKIMGTNFFGVEESSKYFTVKPSKQEIVYMSRVPFSENTLIACKDTHFLVAVAQISIVDICTRTATTKLPKYQKLLIRKRGWYNNQAFANESGQMEWRLIRKTLVFNSLLKNWKQQVALLDDKTEEVPNTRVMVYAIIGHYLNTGERLFEKLCVRCSDVDSGFYRVYVGEMDTDGLDIYHSCSDGFVYDYVGVASSIKLHV